jgi:hypothetical protein
MAVRGSVARRIAGVFKAGLPGRKVANLAGHFDNKALSGHDPEHGKNSERGRHR